MFFFQIMTDKLELMSYFTRPVAQNPQVKHPAEIPWMKTHNRNTQSEIIQCSESFTPVSLLIVPQSHRFFPMSAFPFLFVTLCSSE